MSEPASEQDNDQAHIVIMATWVRRIVAEVADEVADGVVDRVSRIFLDAKTSNYEMSRNHRLRFEALEAAIADLRARTKDHG
jgi:hypothetical protein